MSERTERVIEITDDAEQAAAKTVEHILAAGRRAQRDGDRFSFALSGGSTPRAAYRRLAELAARGDTGIDWSRVDVWFSDERAVPPDDPSSNYRMACEAMLSRPPLSGVAIHRIEGEHGARDAAERYQHELERVLGASRPPRLDLILLGMGDDGHTASLFPNTPVLDELEAWVTIGNAPVPPVDRVTLTIPLLNAARAIVFLVTGAGKADRLHEVLEGSRDPKPLPAQLIEPIDGTITWVVDRAAARLLP